MSELRTSAAHAGGGRSFDAGENGAIGVGPALTDEVARLVGAGVNYGEIQALAPTDLGIARGVSVALVGSNGSGKSTVLGLLAGLVKPSRGQVRVGDDVRTGFVAQQHGHHRWMPLSVREVIAMGRFGRLGLLGRMRGADRNAVQIAAERLEVVELMRRPVSELSGGQRQRVLVAQALVDDPDLLLLDEPITGLDLASQRVILEVIDQQRQRGAAVVFSTHHLDEAREADRVVLLAGRVVADGAPADVLTPHNLAEAFGGRLIKIGPDTVVLDEHGHGVQHDDCDHPDPGTDSC
jgi:ABC-type Mn2+/Zn2+ transport system ATPase subunit